MEDQSYDETIAEILRIVKEIPTTKAEGDGRTDSALKETPFIEEMKRQLLEAHPSWKVVISPPRAPCDVMVNSIRINLKLTECKSSDNSVNKPSTKVVLLLGKTKFSWRHVPCQTPDTSSVCLDNQGFFVTLRVVLFFCPP
jgi:hypothetical protein